MSPRPRNGFRAWLGQVLSDKRMQLADASILRNVIWCPSGQVAAANARSVRRAKVALRECPSLISNEDRDGSPPWGIRV
jgi:hypothetical protein